MKLHSPQVKELWLLLTDNAVLLFSKAVTFLQTHNKLHKQTQACKNPLLKLSGTFKHTYILPKISSCRSESQLIWANQSYSPLAKIISQADINKMTFVDKKVDGIGKLSPLCRTTKGQAHTLVLPLLLCIRGIKNFYMTCQALGSYWTSLPNDNRECDRNRWKQERKRQQLCITLACSRWN